MALHVDSRRSWLICLPSGIQSVDWLNSAMQSMTCANQGGSPGSEEPARAEEPVASDGSQSLTDGAANQLSRTTKSMLRVAVSVTALAGWVPRMNIRSM